MKKDKKALLGLGLVIIVAVVALIFVNKQEKSPALGGNQKTTVQVKSDWTTYKNSEIGIEFNYPKKWGQILDYTATSTYQNWYNDPNYTPPSKPYKFAWFWIGQPGQNRSDRFVSLTAGYNDRPRDGSSSDSSWVLNQKVVSEYCKQPGLLTSHYLAGCKVYTNSNGIIVARLQLSQYINDESGEVVLPTIYYYVFTGNQTYPGLTFTLIHVTDAGDMDKVIESLKLIK